MTIANLHEKLSKLYPEELRCEWDNDGLMCCDNPEKEVKSVLVSLDVTMNTVDYAIANRFDLIVSHHPLVFNSQKSLTPFNYTQRKLIKLIKAGVSVLSFHTRLDSADGGVNDILCNLLNLRNITKDIEEKVGRVAELKDSVNISTFVENVKTTLNTPFVLYNGDNMVKKVYVIGGDGKDMISRALELGADTLLTGRASYNTITDAADIGLNIIEAGHFFTENPVCNKIRDDILAIDGSIKTEIFNSYEIKNK